MVVDPRQRRRCIAAGVTELTRLKCPLFDFTYESSAHGDRFFLRYQLRSIMQLRLDAPVWSRPGHWHILQFEPSAAFPANISNQDIRFSSEPIFHPNVFTDGRVCIRNHVPSESLGRFALRMAELIRFNPIFIGEDSPANLEARDWYIRHRNVAPTDTCTLPTLDGLSLGTVRTPMTLGRITR
jgi:hypothetical protein